MRRVLSVACLAAVAAASMQAQPHTRNRAASQILMPGQDWTLLGQGYQLTADSAVDPLGNVYFTDARTNRILKIDLDGAVTTWKQDSNGSHGIAFGPDGRLYAGQHDRKRIVAFSSTGAESVIAEEIQTHHLTVTSRNAIYFTEAPTHKVWLVDATGGKRVVHQGFNLPRSVRASPDQTTLLVSDPPTNRIWTFRIWSDGSLIEGKPAYQLEATVAQSDFDAGGMAFDSEGFLYVATRFGVQVFNRQCRIAATIPAPGSQALSNVLFAGPALQWLYVMDGERVYRRPVQRRGAPVFHQLP